MWCSKVQDQRAEELRARLKREAAVGQQQPVLRSSQTLYSHLKAKRLRQIFDLLATVRLACSCQKEAPQLQASCVDSTKHGLISCLGRTAKVLY